MATPEQQQAFAAEVKHQEALLAGTAQPRPGTQDELLRNRAITDPNSGHAAGHFDPVSRPDVREPTPDQKIAALDADLQRQGLQKPNNAASTEPDPQLVGALQAWLRENGASLDNLKKFEAGIAQAFRGRRYGETPSQFEARMAAGDKPDNAPAGDKVAEHAALGINVESDVYKAMSPKERDAAAQLMESVLPSEQVPDFLLSGYKLPPGLTFEVGLHAPLLAVAQEKGFAQHEITDFLRAEPADISRHVASAPEVMNTESVPAALRSGYALPPGLEFIPAIHGRLLAQAKAAGFTQRDIAAFIGSGL